MRRSALAVLVPALLASCVAPPAGAPPRPVTPMTVAPPPEVAIVPAPVADGPVELGAWEYSKTPRGGVARFGTGNRFSLILECVDNLVQVVTGDERATLTLRASTSVRTIKAVGGSAIVPARDPILDALAFSRGRFGVGERWYPAWPEVTRVIEDCRA